MENEELENQEEVIVEEQEQEELDNGAEYDEETLEAFKKLWIDPENATIDDLVKVAKRAAKAESTVVNYKKTVKNVEKQKPESSQDLELRLFFIENPEFKEDKEWIVEILSQEKYKNLTPQEASILYKATKPKESTTKRTDFSGGFYKAKPKTLWELSDEEAMKLNPNEYIKYLKAKWELS